MRRLLTLAPCSNTLYSHLKEEALDRTMWRAGFGRGFGPVVRQTTKWMNILFLPTENTIKCGRSRDIHSWPIRNVAEQLCASYKLFDFIQRLNCGHIFSGYWLLFFMIGFLKKNSMETFKKAFCLYCCFRSDIRELLEWRRFRVSMTRWRLASLHDIQFVPHGEHIVLEIKSTFCKIGNM